MSRGCQAESTGDQVPAEDAEAAPTLESRLKQERDEQPSLAFLRSVVVLGSWKEMAWKDLLARGPRCTVGAQVLPCDDDMSDEAGRGCVKVVGVKRGHEPLDFCTTRFRWFPWRRRSRARGVPKPGRSQTLPIAREARDASPKSLQMQQSCNQARAIAGYS